VEVEIGFLHVLVIVNNAVNVVVMRVAVIRVAVMHVAENVSANVSAIVIFSSILIFLVILIGEGIVIVIAHVEGNFFV